MILKHLLFSYLAMFLLTETLYMFAVSYEINF
jgi:hypothetical protein